jgi:Peptidase inhibitor family I36
VTGLPVRARMRALVGGLIALTLIGSASGIERAMALPVVPPSVQSHASREAVHRRAPSDCSSGFVCLWGHVGFEGAMISIPHQTDSWDSLGTFSNRARSFVNNKGYDARLAENADGSGDHHCLPAQTQQSTMGSFNGKASAIYVYGNNDVCNN